MRISENKEKPEFSQNNTIQKSENFSELTRRALFRNALLGAAGLAFGSCIIEGCTGALSPHVKYVDKNTNKAVNPEKIDALNDTFNTKKESILSKQEEEKHIFIDSFVEELKKNGWKISLELRKKIEDAVYQRFPKAGIGKDDDFIHAQERGRESRCVDMSYDGWTAFKLFTDEGVHKGNGSIRIFFHDHTGQVGHEESMTVSLANFKVARISYEKKFFDVHALKNKQLPALESYALHEVYDKKEEKTESTEVVAWDTKKRKISITEKNGRTVQIQDIDMERQNGEKKFVYDAR